ncbi:hypothetical protein K503DRAFT_777775, partial [Rhizopogon vinicolor AM-OR11-026]
MRSGVNPEDNSRRASTPITQSSSTPSSAPILTDRAVSLIVDVPLAQAQRCSGCSQWQRYRVDEDFDSYPLSPTQNPKSQHPSTAANTNRETMEAA